MPPQAEVDTPPGYEDLYEFSFDGEKKRNLSRLFQGTVGSAVPIPEAGGTALQEAEIGVQFGITRFGPNKPAPLTMGSPVVRQLHTNERRNGWVYLASSSTQPDTLYYAPSLDAAGRELATPALSERTFLASASQLVHSNNEGRQIEGLLNLPPATNGQRVPLVMETTYYGNSTGWYHGNPPGPWVMTLKTRIHFNLWMPSSLRSGGVVRDVSAV